MERGNDGVHMFQAPNISLIYLWVRENGGNEVD